MKIQCDVCERSKATVICCADEAALCTECDKRVHTANKLANKHQRIPFLAPTDAPRCDICQVCSLRLPYFLCRILCFLCFLVLWPKIDGVGGSITLVLATRNRSILPISLKASADSCGEKGMQ
jgi:hypothetical protein